MKIRMIALDLDGTLFDNKGKITKENLDILKEAHNAGICIVLSSGRMTDCISPVAEQLGIDCPLIAYNGAMVRACKSENRKMIFHMPLSAGHTDMLIDYSVKNHFQLNYYLDDILYAQDDKKFRKYARIYANQTGAVYHYAEDLLRFKGKPSTKLILITDTEKRDEQYKYFSSLFGKELSIVRTNPEYLEFMNKNANKGVGLQKVAEYYNIPMPQVIAFGDGDNDSEMLAKAGIGIAMANATPITKKAAKIISKWANNESGVAKELQEYI